MFHGWKKNGFIYPEYLSSACKQTQVNRSLTYLAYSSSFFCKSRLLKNVFSHDTFESRPIILRNWGMLNTRRKPIHSLSKKLSKSERVELMNYPWGLANQESFHKTSQTHSG